MDWSYLTVCILNAYFSYSTTILNTVAICTIMKTSTLSRNFKTLLLSLAVSDLGIGLLAMLHILLWTQHKEWNQWHLQCHIYYNSYPNKFLPFCIIFQCHGAMCRQIFGHSTSPQIPGTCDIQACCYCHDLNLSDKCTYFTDQVIHPKKYHVRNFCCYFFCLYHKCNFPEC